MRTCSFWCWEGPGRASRRRLKHWRCGAGRPVTYVATGVVTDEDMGARVAAHRARRPDDWATLEVGADLVTALAGLEGTVLIDALGTWLAGHPDFAADVDGLCAVLGARSDPTIVVSDEVGLGVHPSTEVGRRFRDALGAANRRVADCADRVLLVVAGRVLDLPRAADAAALVRRRGPRRRAGDRRRPQRPGPADRAGRCGSADPPGPGLVRARGSAGGEHRRGRPGGPGPRCSPPPWPPASPWPSIWPSPVCSTSTAWPTRPTACCPPSSAAVAWPSCTNPMWAPSGWRRSWWCWACGAPRWRRWGPRPARARSC